MIENANAVKNHVLHLFITMYFVDYQVMYLIKICIRELQYNFNFFAQPFFLNYFYIFDEKFVYPNILYIYIYGWHFSNVFFFIIDKKK